MYRSSLVLALSLALACVQKPIPVTDAPIAVEPTPKVADAEPTSPPLPLDPAVRMGTLDNGMTYYVRHHEKPKQRALLWLAVDAGSVLEDDDQRGLAHFVEHMAFNGTKRFEKNAIIDFLERAGMDFGADLNAYTSFDETVYQLKIPTDDPELLTRGFDVLEDWAGALTFDPAEVDKERGVVVEEWRRGRGASQRVFDKQWPIFLEGSKYAVRKPIGEKEILEKAPVEALQRFYRDWYRPDLMAVIVVGDVDPAAMEKEIRARFSDLKGPKDARARVNEPVPLQERTRVALETDPELTATQVSLAIKGPLTPRKTEADFRLGLIESLFHGMMRARFDELRRKPDAPFLFAFSMTRQMGRSVDVFTMSAGAKPGKAEPALRVLITEVERVEQHGFLATELERQKAAMLRNYETSATEVDTIDSRVHAREIVRHFLDDRALPGHVANLELAKKLLPGITLDEVNALAESWTGRKDRVIEASGPARDAMPEKAALLAVEKAVAKQKLDPWEDKGAAESLMAEAPKPGSILKKEALAEVGVSVWTLSNGARVIVKPTDFKKDEVLFEAFSAGGHSLAPAKTWGSAKHASAIQQGSGIGEHDEVSLRKLLAGKVANVEPWISELEEGLSGTASPQDLELLLQMAHLHFTAPRKDPEAFEAWRESTRSFVKNRDLSPQQVFFETMTKVGSSDHPRRRPVTTEEIDAVSLDTAHAFYRERFANAGDFTFVFVGNVDEAKLEQLVAQYLASLPATGRKEKWKNVGIRYPRGVSRTRVEKGQDHKSFVMLNFHGGTKWSQEADDDMRILADVLDIRLREVLREDMSGVYGVSSNGSLDRRPVARYGYTVSFGCSPDNADALKTAVLDVLATVKKEGVAQTYVDKVKEQRKRRLETQKRENRFWLRELAKHYRYGTDPKQILELEKSLERINSAAVQRSAKRFIDTRRYLDGLLVPEAKPAGTEPAAAAPKTPPATAAAKTSATSEE